MARISAYPKHLPVQPEDYWIGTRASNLMTRNFTAEAVGEYINTSGSISMATCMLFKFKVTNAGPGDVTGVPNETPFSLITSLQINTLDVSDQDTVGFLEYIVGTEITISEQNEISTFGHYSIDSYTQIDDTAFYTMSLTYIGGPGFIEHDKQYNICSFVLSDTDTTYELDSIQNGPNSDIRLIGSDLTENIVKLQAGTNVTLTDTGSNILIDVSSAGTVTSIDASIDGDSLSVAGVPITSSGTIAFNWEGTNLQYVDGEGNLQTFPTIPTGTVTSVGQTHAGNAFSVTGSPITTAGVLAIGLNGNATQYIDGAGDLQIFPEIPSVGDGTLTVQGTGVLDGTGTFTANQAGDTTISITHDNQSQTNTTPSTTLTHGGTFTALSANVSVNASGHVTGQELTTFTLPSDSQGVTSVNFTTDGTALNVVSNTVTTSGTMTGVWQGNASQYVNGEGDLQAFPAIPVVPTNIVETIDTTDGIYINLTPNAPTTGDVVVTADLSAIDGNAVAGERYLTKTNKWAEISTIPGTYEWEIQGDTGGPTVVNSTNIVTFVGGTNVSTALVGTTLTIDATDTNTTYDLTVPVATTDITLLGSDASSDSVTLTGGTNITVTRVSATELSIDGTDLNTTYNLEGVGSVNGTAGVRLAGSDASNDDVLIIGAGTTTVTRSLNTLTVTSNDQFDGTVTSVSASTTGDALDVAVTNPTTTPDLDFTWAGTASQYVDGQGDLQTFPAIPVVPSNIVETFSNNNTGTYVAYGVTNTGATGDINIGEVDLTAVDGTAIAGERYLTKSNTWATVASIPGTYEWSIAADSGGETILSGDAVNFIGGTNVTTSYDSGLNELTINSTDQFQGTVTSVATTHAGNAFTANIGNVATINPSVDITMNGSSADYIDGAGNLQTFPTIPQGDITDVEGGTYITTDDSTGPVVTVNHDLTSRTNTASAITTSAGDTITAVDSVTTNTTGHVEAINLKSVTLPTGSLTSEVVDIQVKNISSADGGINLVKGDPVYIYGSVGASPRLYVDLADADSTATNNLGDGKMPCVGLLDQDLSPNGEGTATVVGKLRNLITSPIGGDVPNENDTVYVKSGGGLTLIKPTGSTNLIQNVGQVGRVSTSNDGNIVVAALLRTNDVPNLPTGRLFVGTAANTSLASDVVYVDDALDRVGIGTSSPGSSLEVAGEIDSVGGDGYLVEGIPWARSNSGLLELGDWDGVGYDTSILGANGNLAIRTLGGNVGIGTTTPGTYRLAVAGSTAIGGNVEVSDGLGGDKVLTLTANTGSFAIGDIDGLGDEAHIEGDSSNIKIFTSGTERVRVNSSGNVGMGTTSLTNISSTVTTLSLGGTNTSFSGGIAFQVNGVVKAYNYVVSNYLINQTVAGVGQVFYGAGSERMRIHNTTGNIGVNTVSPFAKLHVASGSTSDAPTAGTATGGLWVSNFSKTFGTNIGVSGSGWSFIQGQRADGNTTLYNLNLQPLGGNVGIGTTNPTAILQVEGSKDGPVAEESRAIVIGNNTKPNAFYNNGIGVFGKTIQSNGMAIHGDAATGGGFGGYFTGRGYFSGNVGIGTTVANVRLEIGGGSSLARVIPSINNQGYIGDSGHRWQAIYATNGTIQTSDIREKTEIKPTKLGLDFINDLNPVSYKWIEGERLDANKDERNHQGLIAQEVAKTLEKHGVDKNKFGGLDIQKTDEYDDFHAMSYEQLIAPMIKAIQELKAEIEELKKQINK